jgi:hypothetical protein
MKEGVKALLVEDPSSVVFIKLYLITKEQMADILKMVYDVNEDEKVLINAIKSIDTNGIFI